MCLYFILLITAIAGSNAQTQLSRFFFADAVVIHLHIYKITSKKIVCNVMVIGSLMYDIYKIIQRLLLGSSNFFKDTLRQRN